MRASILRRTVLVAALLLTPGLAVSLQSETSSAYSLVREAGGRWRADNEAQRLRVEFTPDGLRVVPQAGSRPPWEWGLRLTRYGSPWDLRDAPDPVLSAEDDRLEYRRGSLVEWVRNDPDGIEHGWELMEPSGPALMRLEFTLTGSLTPKVTEEGRTVTFRNASGATVLASIELRGVDAEGRDLAVQWERIEPQDATAAALRLTLQGADHVFPLRVTSRLVTSKAAAATRQASTVALTAAPANDLCGGAEVIPGNGPFPYFSSVVEIGDATALGDPPPPSCQASVSRSVWYVFTPSATAFYNVSVCADAPTATTVEDTVLAIYSASGSCAGFSEINGGCDDDSCGPVALQSAISDVALTAGTTYYIVAWTYGTIAPPPGAGSLQLQVVKQVPPGPAPGNDLCEGAEPIPGAGPFPYLTSVTADVGGATIAGDPPGPSCQPNVSRSIWYSFTPSMTGRYAFSVCADGPTGTTLDDTVLALYSATATCSGFVEMTGGCDDDSCASEAAQSLISGVGLTAGTKYYVVAWKYGSAAPVSGNGAIQLRVSLLGSPPNDTCAAATTLPLDSPIAGTTVGAQNDAQLPSGSPCFAGIGQTGSTASGAEVAYRFTAPAQGRYSFRVSGYDTSRNAVLYVSSACPAGATPASVVDCLGAANRSPTSPEEVSCLPLEAGQTVHIFVDEDARTTGSAFTLEANPCRLESEPNGSIATAGEPVCGIEGSIAPPGDCDVYALGIPEPGARVFAMVDGAAGNSTDFDLRVTTDSDTLEYDDLNNDVPYGNVAPNVSGTRLNGAASYLRVTHYSIAAQAEPYRLYAAVQRASTTATPEVEPNNTVLSATGGVNEYYSGRLSDAGDLDFFSFSAIAGEMIQIGLDLDPARDATPFNGSLALLSPSGTTLMLANDSSLGSSTVTGNGSLTATTPGSPGEAIAYRIRSDGTYYAKVAWSGGTPGDYLLSITHDCRVSPPADLEVTQTDTPDPAPNGGGVTYTVVVRNPGLNPASVVTLRDDLPAGSILTSANPTQGVCAGSGPLICHLGTLEAGGSARVSVTVSAPAVPGVVANHARVSTAVIDISSANDDSIETTVVGPPSDGDGDGVPDASDCAPADAAAWSVPGEAIGPVLVAGGATVLSWSAPASTGGAVVQYDVLRSTTPGSFSSAACLATGTTASSAIDSGIPGTVFYYLVRAENACGGNLGLMSDGTPRTGVACP